MCFQTTEIHSDFANHFGFIVEAGRTSFPVGNIADGLCLWKGTFLDAAYVHLMNEII